MIRTQKEYADYVSSVVDCLPEELDKEKQKYRNLLSHIKKTELIIPVVGGFSAGKSTLINLWLGEKILPTNLAPETALATELRYSTQSYIEAVKKDDTAVRYETSQQEEIKANAKQYKYLRLYLNNEKLKSIEPLVLVDMPGFDSPVELHNTAILNYLERGIYFVVLSSIEDGTLAKSIIGELENISEYGKGFSFCLSKANLRSDSDVQFVKENIEQQLDDLLDFQGAVTPLYDDAGGEELNKILKSIDSEDLFSKVFKQALKDSYQETESTINTVISTSKRNKEEVASILSELKETQNKIIRQKNKMIEEAQSQRFDSKMENIINGVEQSLKNNQNSLVASALNNRDAFSREVNEIVKNSLVQQVKEQLSGVSKELVSDFSIEMGSLGDIGESFGMDQKWIDNVSNSTINLLKGAQEGLNNFADAKNNSSSASGLNSYRFISTALALTTSVINPILEIVIVFLPEILKLFSQGNKEAEMRKKVEDNLLFQVIPSIKSKIRSELPSLFQAQIDNIVNTIGDKFESELAQKTEEISKEQEKKAQNQEVIEQRIADLEAIRGSVRDLANHYLYKV